jgi:hypothetical protein
MSRKLSGGIIFKTVLDLMRPILVPVIWAVEKTYAALFGHRDLRLSKEDDERLAQEIRSNLSFLFDDYGARIVPDETLKHPRPFDYAVVIVSLDELSFRFIRGRGEFRVQVVPNRTPSVWEDLPLVLAMVDAEFERREFSSFLDVAASLKHRMKLLQEAFSADRCPELQQQLSEVHSHERAVIRQWETEMDRRLYPDR